MRDARTGRRPSAAAKVHSAALVLLTLAGVLGCGGCAKHTRGLNVCLVVLDTVRRDFTGVGGDSRAVSCTPRLDALAAEGVTFTNAYANAPWTVPSHASLFTGQLPSEHGCTSANLRFASAQPTEAELLSQAGWETAAFYSNPWLSDRSTGLLRGFAERLETPIGSLHQMKSALGDQGGQGVLVDLSRWFDQRRDGRSFYVFVNFLEAHLPYDPPTEYRRVHLADLPPEDKVTIRWGHEYSAGLHPYETVDWSRVRRLYGGDVNTSDQELAALVEILKRHDAWQRTVLIVTSDHGENLGDHRLVEHQFSVHETLLAVPLVIWVPDGANRALAARGLALPQGRDDRPVMLTDLYATILDLASVLPPSLPPHSRSLLLAAPAAAEGTGGVEDPRLGDGVHRRALVAEYAGPGPGLLGLLKTLRPELDPAPLSPALRTLRWGDWRLTIASSGQKWLNDLRQDADQEHDLAAQFPDSVALLDSLLLAIAPSRGFVPADEGQLDEVMRRRLRSLGYVH